LTFSLVSSLIFNAHQIGQSQEMFPSPAPIPAPRFNTLRRSFSQINDGSSSDGKVFKLTTQAPLSESPINASQDREKGDEPDGMPQGKSQKRVVGQDPSQIDLRDLQNHMIDSYHLPLPADQQVAGSGGSWFYKSSSVTCNIGDRADLVRGFC
jgi:hypothetical protein